MDGLNVLLGKLSSLLFALHIAVAASLVSPPPVPEIKTQADVRSYVVAMADYYDVPSYIALFIVEHESGFGWRDGKFNPSLAGKEKDGYSYGIWQFYDRNDDFDKNCAIDLECSTKMAMEWLRSGKQDRWSTWRLRCPLYGVC